MFDKCVKSNHVILRFIATLNYTFNTTWQLSSRKKLNFYLKPNHCISKYFFGKPCKQDGLDLNCNKIFSCPLTTLIYLIIMMHLIYVIWNRFECGALLTFELKYKQMWERKNEIIMLPILN